MISSLTTLLIFGFVSSVSLAATTVTESFTSRANLDSDGGMVWNHALGELHPPLISTAAVEDGNPVAMAVFSVGDGRNGAFVLSRYHLFDTDGDVSSMVIEINTDTYPDLQFTEFDLDKDYTIRPVGSRPLVIRSLSDVIVDGTINCSGEDGEAAVADINTLRSGGTGHCGGGDGGDSVLPGAAPGADNEGAEGGLPLSVTGFGGKGGNGASPGGNGGGGGGAFIKDHSFVTDFDDPKNGDSPTIVGAGGGAGDLFRDDAFDDDLDGAGSGGGGGSSYHDPGDVPNHSSGAGGGAGGGNIRIYAVRDIIFKSDQFDATLQGVATADGGQGGAGLGGLKGGGGGGGGGGSILMFAGRNIVFNGPVTAAAGNGGVSAGGDGGTGAWGRTWIIDLNGIAGGVSIENPETRLDVPGQIEYETGVPYTVTSAAIELGNTQPTLTLLPMTVVNQVNTTVFTYELAFSEVANLVSLANFALDATYLNTVVKRFARFRLTFDNTGIDSTTAVRIQDLAFTLTPAEKKEFQFVTGCGNAKDTAEAALDWWTLVIFLPLVLVFSLRRRQ